MLSLGEGNAHHHVWEEPEPKMDIILTIAAEYKDGFFHVTATKMSGESPCGVMEFQSSSKFSTLEETIKDTVDPENEYNVVLVIGTRKADWDEEPLSQVFMQEMGKAAEDQGPPAILTVTVEFDNEFESGVFIVTATDPSDASGSTKCRPLKLRPFEKFRSLKMAVANAAGVSSAILQLPDGTRWEHEGNAVLADIFEHWHKPVEGRQLLYRMATE